MVQWFLAAAEMPGLGPENPNINLSFARREPFWVFTFKISTSSVRIFSSKFAFSLRFSKFSTKSWDIHRPTPVRSRNWTEALSLSLWLCESFRMTHSSWYFRLEQVSICNVGSLHFKIENLAFDTVQFVFLKFLRRSFFNFLRKWEL